MAIQINTFVFMIAICMLPMLSMRAKAQELSVVDSVDLKRYAGTWYEIVRLPNGFENKCAGNVTATYTLLDNGEIKVINRCQTQDGDTTEAEGLAKRASNEQPNSKLKVRFAPSFLSFLTFVWGNYWILDLAPDYSYVVVGEPNRKNFWVLARKPTMDEQTLRDILGRAKKQGYDLTTLIRTRQSER